MFLFTLFSLIIFPGSLGARINELKQRVIAENPHRYGIAVPRESAFTDHTKYSCADKKNILRVEESSVALDRYN